MERRKRLLKDVSNVLFTHGKVFACTINYRSVACNNHILVLDRVSKRKLSESENKDDVRHVLGQFVSENGELLESPIDLPLSVTSENLQLICSALIQKNGDVEVTPYTFFVNEKEVTNTLETALSGDILNSEQILRIIYQPQAVFQVRAVTRCTRYAKLVKFLK